MANGLSPAVAEPFYRAALVGLRVLEAETRRRFGADADARWKGFAGHLRTIDRIDLLLRDAAVTWGPAFSGALVFQLPGLAPDEAFGPDWPQLTEDAARRLWKTAQAAQPGDLLAQAAAALALQTKEIPDCDGLTPATRLLVTGAGAILAAARAFKEDERLSWAEQVAVIAARPTERQLAGLAAVILGARGHTRLISPDHDSPADAIKQAGLSRVDRLLVSDDADPACRSFAERAAAG